MKDGAARADPQVGKLRQIVDDAFSDPIRKVFRVRILILIVEWQHRDRFDSCFGVAPVKIRTDANGSRGQGNQNETSDDCSCDLMLFDSADDVLST
jgi:hypothetical protein